MKFRRQWMIVIVVSVALSVLVNSFLTTALINRYFIDYSQENYKKHVSQVVDFSTKALLTNEYNQKQLEMQLNSHLSDPISRIRLYDVDGNLLADVGTAAARIPVVTRNSVMGRMMSRMMGTTTAEVDTIDITNNGTVIGKLNITRYSSIGNSLSTRRFLVSLVGFSLLSFGIVLGMTSILGYFLSEKMSRDLKLTAQQARDIELGQKQQFQKSNVVEIQTIQQSLETLETRLLLKQTSRKKLVDALVHQTRTPLTILQTHLEGFQDGIIQFNPEEIATCETQIENLSSIITNMSGLIDAQKEIEALSVSSVEVSGLIKQIVNGLKAQFEQKSVALTIASAQKLTVQTDAHQLSQAIYNILTNAYKFTPSGGAVIIDYSVRGNRLVIHIQDTGAGIAAEDQPKIFDAYYRGKNSLDTQGEGIGLYIVKENLAKLGGTIELESILGVGSKFIIKLPLEYKPVESKD